MGLWPFKKKQQEAEVRVSKDEVLSRIREQLRLTLTNPEPKAKEYLLQFAQGFLGSYIEQNANWQNDAEISSLASAIENGNPDESLRLLKVCYDLLDLKASREAEKAGKDREPVEKELFEQFGILPPISFNFTDEVMAALELPEAEQLPALAKIAFDPRNTTRYAKDYEMPLSGVRRYSWTDLRTNPPSLGMFSVEVHDGGKIRPYVCHNTEVFFVKKTSKGFDIIAPLEEKGTFAVQDSGFNGTPELIKDPVKLEHRAAEAALISSVHRKNHKDSGGICGSCASATETGDALCPSIAAVAQVPGNSR